MPAYEADVLCSWSLGRDPFLHFLLHTSSSFRALYFSGNLESVHVPTEKLASLRLPSSLESRMGEASVAANTQKNSILFGKLRYPFSSKIISSFGL